MKLSKPTSITRKATSLICSMLVLGQTLPSLYKEDKFIWATNGFVGFCWPKRDFIFNDALFRQMDISEALKESREGCVHEGRIDSYKPMTHKMVVKLVSDNVAPVYVNREYLDMFKDCRFMTQGELKPVLVVDFYGSEVGIILPMRLSDSQKW